MPRKLPPGSRRPKPATEPVKPAVEPPAQPPQPSSSPASDPMQQFASMIAAKSPPTGAPPAAPMSDLEKLRAEASAEAAHARIAQKRAEIALLEDKVRGLRRRINEAEVAGIEAPEVLEEGEPTWDRGATAPE